MITPADLRLLSAAQRTVVLDVTQVGLDIIGIFDPTPTADLTNAAISLARADFLGAAISVVSVVPFAGDLAKFGNLQRYAKTIDNAIAAARNDQRLAAVLRPVLGGIVSAIDAIPLGMIMPKARAVLVPLETMRNNIVAFIGKRALKGIDLQVDDMLVALMGSSLNVGALPRRNARFLVEYLNKNGVLKAGESLFTQGTKLSENARGVVDKFRGTDLHAVDAFTTRPINRSQRFVQWIDVDKAQHTFKLDPLDKKVVRHFGADGSETKMIVGEWFLTVGSGVNHTAVGLSANGRKLQEFVFDKTDGPLEFLVTKAKSTQDTWTYSRADSFAGAHKGKNAEDLAKIKKEMVQGGGEQLFLPNAYKHARPVDRPVTKPAFPAVKR